MKKLIGIEGSSYAGKTTVANELANMGYGVIPEYDAFGPFPKSDGSVRGLKEVVDELLDREVQRSKLITSKVTYFEDRTPISLVTFEEMKAFHADSVDRERVHKEIGDYVLSRIVQLSEGGKITLPNGVAVLRVTDRRDFERRVKKRGVTAVGELALFATQLHVAQKSLEHATLLPGVDKSTMIDVDAKSPQVIARELVYFAKQI